MVVLLSLETVVMVITPASCLMMDMIKISEDCTVGPREGWYGLTSGSCTMEPGEGGYTKVQ